MIETQIQIDKYFEDSSLPVGKAPSIVVLMGGICSGKTTLRRELYSTDFVLVDAVEIFLSLCNGEYFELGEAYEDELNEIGRLIVKRAVQERRNIVTEVVGDDAGEVTRLVDCMESIGYTIHLRLVECDRDIAWERNVSRGIDSISAIFAQPYHYKWFGEVPQY